MTTRFGACNAQTFSVHHDGVCSGLVGNSIPSPKALDVWARRNTTTDTTLFRATAPGQQWGWHYEDIHCAPSVRVIRNSDDSILYVWEAETICDPARKDYVPMMETDDYGTSIIPAGGSAVWLFGWPTSDDFSSLQSDVEAASLPSWITDTEWDTENDTLYLLRKLFAAAQSVAGITIRSTIEEALNKDMTVEQYFETMLLWMRCASQILYDHMGKTCIPLLLDKFNIDENGVLSLA